MIINEIKVKKSLLDEEIQKKLENILNFAYHLKIKFNFKNVKKLYHFKEIFGHIFKLILKKFLIK